MSADKAEKFKIVGVVGLGLIGSSFAKAFTRPAAKFMLTTQILLFFLWEKLQA